MQRSLLRAGRGKQIRYAYRVDELAEGARRFVLLLGTATAVTVQTRQRRSVAK